MCGPRKNIGLHPTAAPIVELDARLDKLRVALLSEQVKVLEVENYRLQRQHQLLTTFNYVPLLEKGDDAVDVIERAIDYSRQALGQPPVSKLDNSWEETMRALAANPNVRDSVLASAEKTQEAVEQYRVVNRTEAATNCCGGCCHPPPVDNDHVAPGCEPFSPETIAANAEVSLERRKFCPCNRCRPNPTTKEK